MSSVNLLVLAALAAFAACGGNASPASDPTQNRGSARAGSDAVVTEPTMCDRFRQAVHRLQACPQMRDELRDTFLKEERDVASRRDSNPPLLAKCQMLLHMLRIDVTLDCPDLAPEIPDVPIPL